MVMSGIVCRHIVVAGALLLVGCAFNYEEAELARELGESVPSIVLQDPEYVFQRSVSRTIRISAAAVEIFSSSNEQRFMQVAFIETDTEGEVLNSGSADEAMYNTDSGNFELFGNVNFNSVEHDAIVQASYLLWNEDEERLYGREDDAVSVERSSGTVIAGLGLVADLRSRTIEMQETSGTIYPQQEDPAVLRDLRRSTGEGGQ